jgi:hypothetical protein
MRGDPKTYPDTTLQMLGPTEVGQPCVSCEQSKEES